MIKVRFYEYMTNFFFEYLRNGYSRKTQKLLMYHSKWLHKLMWKFEKIAWDNLKTFSTSANSQSYIKFKYLCNIIIYIYFRCNIILILDVLSRFKFWYYLQKLKVFIFIIVNDFINYCEMLKNQHEMIWRTFVVVHILKAIVQFQYKF